MGESGNGTAGEYLDAGANAHHGTGGDGSAAATPSRVSGKIGFAQQFDGSNDQIHIPYHSNFDLPSVFTISSWVSLQALTSGDGSINTIINKQNTWNDRNFWLVHWNSNWSFRTSPDPNNNTLTSSANSAVQTWVYLTVTADGDSTRLYVDGVLDDSNDFPSIDVQSFPVKIGMEYGNGRYFNGLIDETRVANVTRNVDWIATEYASQNQPTTTVGVTTAGDFYTVSSELAMNPDDFGDNTWHAYCYNTASYHNTNFNYSDYRGMYTQAGLDFSSTDMWAQGSNPSTATGYVGCSVTDNLHIVRYKRRGFPCDYYQLDIAGPGTQNGHDDAAKLFIDGVQVWSNTGCCAQRIDVWQGFLGANSEVEFVWADNGGNSYGRMRFVPVVHPLVSSDVTICAGSSTTLTASGAANYDWSTNPTHLVAPLNTASVVVSPPGATPDGVETYTVSTTDATTGCTVSNTVDVTINPLPNTSVTPTTGSYCASGSVNAIASGANTYTWSPMTGVTVNSPSGDDATLSPSVTTVYTVTGSNNCATEDATVTITVTLPSGDPNDFGNNTWNVYCYDGNNFDTYMGMYEHNTLDFDTRDIWGNNNSPSNAPGYSGCTIPNDNHSYRYKRQGFDCGYYQLDIPNHDDRVRLLINGVLVFSQDTWFNNVYKANVWQGYLDADSEIEYTIREFTGGSNGGLAFIYLFGPNNSANQSVWNGKTDSGWANAGNWCGDVPTSTISAMIPGNGVATNPVISTSAAEVNNITIQSGAMLTISGTNVLGVYGNWTNNGTLTPNNSTVNFLGSTASTFAGAGTNVFNNFTINNSSIADALTLSNNLTINGTLNFVSGRIITGVNRVTFNDNATSSGANNDSYINGICRKIGNDAFTFPVGKAGEYAPISISAPTVATNHFTAEYFNANPSASYDTEQKEAILHHIGACEYWILDRTNGTSNVSVTLSWGDRSCGVTDLTDLRVARWNGTEWVNEGNTGTTGTTTSGTITSAQVTQFSPFTLASVSAANPLPVELISFLASANADAVDLQWTTATETNSSHYVIEKSKNGLDWEYVGREEAAGNSVTVRTYKHRDMTPYTGTSYYRLQQVDNDYSTTTYGPVAVQFDGKGFLTVYPNPVLDRVFIVSPDATSAQLFDNTGKVVLELRLSEGTNEISLDNLPVGLYLLRTQGMTGTVKVTKE